MGMISRFKIRIAKSIIGYSEFLQDRAVNAPIDEGRGRTRLCEMIPEGGIGIELGVASGYFSDALLRFSKLERLYSVDAWADHHDSEEYLRCVRRLRKHGTRSVVLRMFFDEALPLFPDEYFDFIYIDGYAHTGQDGGDTLYSWWPKLKRGGVFSGHDYDPSWPKTVDAVNDFAESVKTDILKIEGAATNNPSDRFQSWYFTKGAI